MKGQCQRDQGPLLGTTDRTRMTAAQLRVIETIEAGPRRSAPLPFWRMLDAPALAEAIQQLGIVIRFESALSPAHREAAILATAGALSSHYEWDFHQPLAADAGVPDYVIALTRPGCAEVPTEVPWDLIVRIARELVTSRRVTAGLIPSSISRLGRQETTELIVIAGYYALLAAFLHCADPDTEL